MEKNIGGSKMNWKNNLRKSELRKMEYSINWTGIKVDYLDIKNKPKDLINMEANFDTVEATAEKAIVNGEFLADIRRNGIKDIGSYATDISLRITFEDTETDLYEEIDIEIDSAVDSIEDDIVEGNQRINPAYIEVKIDMKEQKDPSQFEKTATIWWQGTY
nr:hypothetical protein [bacterium]